MLNVCSNRNKWQHGSRVTVPKKVREPDSYFSGHTSIDQTDKIRGNDEDWNEWNFQFLGYELG
eukprot:1913429-Amphidinium_carterae.1